MNTIHCIKRNDWIIILSNVLFFMVVQTLFFVFIASKQYENVLVAKLELVKSIYTKFPDIKQALLETKDAYIQSKENIVKEQAKKRTRANKDLIWKYCGVPILIVLFTLFYFVFVNVSKEAWSEVDTLGMLYVALGYLTELCFFFFIVKKYEFVGDQYIVSNVLQDVIN